MQHPRWLNGVKQTVHDAIRGTRKCCGMIQHYAPDESRNLLKSGNNNEFLVQHPNLLPTVDMARVAYHSHINDARCPSFWKTGAIGTALNINRYR